jgi:hypothetical protein
VTRILNLQEDHDWQKFGINLPAIQAHCAERGDIEIVRSPLVDFSDDSLRRNLAVAVAELARLLEDGHRVYVHCTAGLGRAPAVVIAYMHWMAGMSLQDAYNFVTTRRRCHPRVRMAHPICRGGSLPCYTRTTWSTCPAPQCLRHSFFRLERGQEQPCSPTHNLLYAGPKPASTSTKLCRSSCDVGLRQCYCQ